MTANPTDIARWAMCAFLSNPELQDGALIDLLEEAGLPHAARAVAMLPLAFGRRILGDMVGLSPTYLDLDSRSWVLAEDPIFAAAERFAREEATKEELGQIGFRSSEVNAVNQALNHGANVEDLGMSPPVLTIADRAEPELPAPQAALDASVRAHGSSLSLRARVFPRELKRGRVRLQLDVVTDVGGRELVEAFSGFGTTIHEAQSEAIQKFCTGTLHVLLAVLDRRALGGEQVEWEAWGEFEACLGGVLLLWKAPRMLPTGDYLEALQRALLDSSLTPEVHWVRTFVATNGKEILGFEVLVDNEPWPPGEALVRSTRWPVSDVRYALRHFFMLVPRRVN